ncbi:MAG TPA: hypothetical protein VGJ07_25045, partial [Rugosimonospora sp.]
MFPLNRARRQRWLALLVAIATALSLVVVTVTPASARTTGPPPRPAQQTSPGQESPHPVTQVCGAPGKPNVARCLALRRTDVAAHRGVVANDTPAGYGPADLRSAYKLPTYAGAGQTVAIVDAYDDPNAEADLAVYRAQYGLP